MKKAIVTGATGFIGSAFVEYLVAHGIDVLALGRKNLVEVMPLRRRRLAGATYLRLDMADVSGLAKRLDEIGWKSGEDCVFINLAWGGVTGLSDMDIEAQIKNVSWSVNALDSALAIGCQKFLQIGTMEEAFTSRYLDLDHTKNSEFNRHVIYSVAKIAAKRAMRVKASQIGLDLTYVLHSHVMGPGDDKDSFLQVTLQKLIDGDELVFSSGEQYFDVISTFDCCQGYYEICRKGKPGFEYWVGSGSPQPLRNYVERMYALFPSNAQTQFGKLEYNDIMLEKSDFSIQNLSEHTGYKPTMTFEQTVTQLHAYLVAYTDQN